MIRYDFLKEWNRTSQYKSGNNSVRRCFDFSRDMRYIKNHDVEQYADGVFLVRVPGRDDSRHYRTAKLETSIVSNLKDYKGEFTTVRGEMISQTDLKNAIGRSALLFDHHLGRVYIMTAAVVYAPRSEEPTSGFRQWDLRLPDKEYARQFMNFLNGVLDIYRIADQLNPFPEPRPQPSRGDAYSLEDFTRISNAFKERITPEQLCMNGIPHDALYFLDKPKKPEGYSTGCFRNWATEWRKEQKKRPETWDYVLYKE